ncbi:isocitrate lyase/PEP mutase family protein [Synergistaceae bacterium OttesenSCG-928-I11]|nr:isocitrate lyase/PEP mutase family protein [Synergistaceae bacterium OttesenSCG-928-I11]
MTKTHNLRELLASPNVLIAPCAYDALSAKMIEATGFSLAGTTGYGMHGAMLGVPDNGMLAFNEVASALGNIASAVGIPVMADAEGGYGNAINTIRTVREFEKTGIAGLFIEDQKLPPNCPYFKQTEMISIEEMVGKIKAAIDTRVDRDFVIVARTDAPFEEAIERCNAYAEAGADMVKAIPTNRQELEAFPERIKAPLHLGFAHGKGVSDGLTAYDAGKMGYKIVTFPFTCLFANTKSVLDVLRILKENGTDEPATNAMLSIEAYFDFIGADYYRTLERKYLPD